MTREGVVVDPYKRLNQEQIERIHQASLQILMDPGIICLNKRAAELFGDAGADVTPITHDGKPAWILKIPEKIISEGIKNAPKKVTLGARDINNSLFLDGKEPRVRFASGSEANNWLDIDVETFISKNNPEKEINIPVFRVEKGNTDKLAQAAHLCENLDSWDSFLRTVNLQDDDITDENKDITKFFVALNNTTKHVMAGLTEISQLENVIKMAQLIAGGEEALKKNPLISFITCVVKSPLQLTNDTAETAIEVAKRGLPLVISSSPQGGSTAPIKEEGMVAQINAEILTGITMTQLARKGAPVLYGSVPVRTRIDNLHDCYGVPEFNQYNIDCIQMARHYSLPCYSTAGVSDMKVPGIQASVERLFSHILVTLAGAQYIHYAFGLLERTNTFCPVQAVLDNTHIGLMKGFVKQAEITDTGVSESLDQIRKVMGTSHKLYVRYIRNEMRTGQITPPYPFEGKELVDETLIRARARYEEILSLPHSHIDKEIIEKIFQQIPGLLPRLKNC